jgi:hypothetical protein
MSNQPGDFIGGGIEGELTRIKNVNFSLGNIPAVRLGLAGVKR